ncbi:MAG: PQQ-binding-like beta-propeller repeat protein [Syntrophobacteraceae bacterium]
MTALLFAGLMFFPLLAPPVAEAGEQWPIYQCNPAHTGFMAVSLDPTKFALRWQKTIGSLALNPVTAAGGLVFVSEVGHFNFNGPSLYVLDSSSGGSIWSQDLGNVYSVNPPSYSDGKVYIQTGQDAVDNIPPYLYAYDAGTGALKWRSEFGAQWENYYAPTVYDGQVYIDGGYYGGMYGFDEDTGYQNWFNNGLPQYDQWTPAVDDNWAYAYTGATDGGGGNAGLYVIDRLSGQQVFTITDSVFAWDGYSMHLAPVLGGLNDVFVINGDRLIRFDLGARDMGWVNTGNFTGQPTVANGTVYAVNAGALGAYDQMTGALLWMWAPPGGEVLRDTIIATNSDVFVGSAANTYCIDLAAQVKVWSYPASGHLALGENTLYIAGSTGTLTAVDLGLNVPDIFVFDYVNFGIGGIGVTLTQTITVGNVGNAPLEVQKIQSSSGEFVVQNIVTPFTIAPHNSASIEVEFAPTATGERSGNLLITSNDPVEPQALIALTGQSYLMHTITATAGDGGQISPVGNLSVVDGGSLDFTITPDAGYQLSSLTVDGQVVENSSITQITYTLNDITENHTITAVFAQSYYTITASAGAGGLITPPGATSAQDGSSLTYTVTPNPSYLLTALIVDGATVGGPSYIPVTYTFSSIDSDHIITAVFAHCFFDYFGMQVGNNYEALVTYANGGTGTETDNITLDTNSSSFLDTEVLDGNQILSWFQVTPNSFLMGQQEENGVTVTYSPALTMVKTPLAGKMRWTAASTVFESGVPVRTKLTAKVSPQELVSVPAGNFMAWPITYNLMASARGRTLSTASTTWFAPYIGTVKSEDSKSTTSLTAFSVGAGTVSIPPPVVTGTYPASATAGNQITINGFQFGSSQGSSVVRIGSITCDQILSWTDTQIQCIVPDTASSGVVTVVTDTWTSNDSVTLKIPPQVTSVAPSSGTRKSTVQIAGINFGAVRGKVKFGSVRAAVAQWSDTSITCTVPATAHIGTCPVTVINSQGENVLQGAFTVFK